MNKRFSDKRVRVGEVQFVNADLLPLTSGTKRHGVDVLVDKGNTEALKLITEAVSAASEDEGDLVPVGDGDDYAELMPNYAGTYFVHATTSDLFAPRVLRGNRIESACNGDNFYSGCYGAAVLTFFRYHTNGHAGVHAAVEHFLKTRDGQRVDIIGGEVFA